MFTVMTIRKGMVRDDYSDPGSYNKSRSAPLRKKSMRRRQSRRDRKAASPRKPPAKNKGGSTKGMTM